MTEPENLYENPNIIARAKKLFAAYYQVHADQIEQRWRETHQTERDRWLHVALADHGPTLQEARERFDSFEQALDALDRPLPREKLIGAFVKAGVPRHEARKLVTDLLQLDGRHAQSQDAAESNVERLRAHTVECRGVVFMHTDVYMEAKKHNFIDMPRESPDKPRAFFLGKAVMVDDLLPRADKWDPQLAIEAAVNSVLNRAMLATQGELHLGAHQWDKATIDDVVMFVVPGAHFGDPDAAARSADFRVVDFTQTYMPAIAVARVLEAGDAFDKEAVKQVLQQVNDALTDEPPASSVTVVEVEPAMTTTDGRDVDTVRAEQKAEGNVLHASYIVLTDEERKKGYVRPVRKSYRHVGIRPQFPLRDLTKEERERYAKHGFVKYEEYTPGDGASGKFWTAAELTSGCGQITTMGLKIAETYARKPDFYGSTFCASCGKHFPVGAGGEFVWVESNGGDGDRVGT